MYNEASVERTRPAVHRSAPGPQRLSKEVKTQFRKDGGVFASDGHVIVFRRNEDSDDRIRGRAYFALRDFTETAGAPRACSA